MTGPDSSANTANHANIAGDAGAVPYVEAAAILAAQDHDLEAMNDLLTDMLPGELAELEAAAVLLASACREVRTYGRYLGP